MKLLIEPPTWLGDSVMASGAIDKLIEYLNPNEVILFGSFVSTELLKTNPKIDKVIINQKKILKNLITLPKADIFISFRRSLASKILGIKYKKKFFFEKIYTGHMVEQYNQHVDDIIYNLTKKSPKKLYPPKLYFTPKKTNAIGINPGATYGSAKRWYPEEFAKVANYLGQFRDIIIFGGPGEEEIAKDIEKHLTIKNYKNLCGKLSIKELCEYIGGLDLFITNDSGPMHIAAAFNVPIIAIFGPTDYTETSPYSNNYKIITKNLECAPCKKRECPLKTHECMKSIKAQDVIKEINESGFLR